MAELIEQPLVMEGQGWAEVVAAGILPSMAQGVRPTVPSDLLGLVPGLVPGIAQGPVMLPVRS